MASTDLNYLATPNEQLQAMRDLRDNWDGYNAAVPHAKVIDLAQEFAGLIEAMLRNSSGAPCVLHVSPTRIGGVLIEWEDHATEHEVEIKPDRSMGFLHLNRATGQIVTRTFSADSPVVLLQELRQLLAA